MIEVTNLSLTFGKKKVLKNISVKLPDEVYGILGSNGAGKTTFMRCLAGLYDHYKGEIVKDGNAAVGYLPQKMGLFPELSVYDNMLYFATMKKIPHLEQKERIQSCLSVTNMWKYKDKKGRQLSGGMLRRVGIAQALLNEPKLLLLDEPTVGLDPEERIHFKEIIQNLRKDKIVMMSTHIVEDMEVCCNTILVMKNGKLCFNGSCEQLREKAMDKVYEVLREDYRKKDGMYVEKEYEKNGMTVKRILSEESIQNENFMPCEPTIEDGYLCVIKKK